MSGKVSERIQLVSKITSAVLGLALIVAAVYLIAIDRSDQIPTIIAVAGLVLGGLGTVGLPSLLGVNRPGKPRAVRVSAVNPDGTLETLLEEKPKRRVPPPFPMLWIVAFAIGIAIPGCGASLIESGRRGIERTGMVADVIDHELAEARRRTSLEVRARPNATIEEHKEAMVPFDRALEVTTDLYSAMESTEHAFDAAEAGEESDWMGLASCVIASFSDLLGIAARHIDVPDEAGEVMLLLGGFARGACPEPEPPDDPEPAEPIAPIDPAPDTKPIGLVCAAHHRREGR